jgi:hypothetical protein
MYAPQVKVRCPKCGKKTSRYRYYKDGSSLYIHRQTKRNKPFPHMMIEDACGVPKKDDEAWTPK